MIYILKGDINELYMKVGDKIPGTFCKHHNLHKVLEEFMAIEVDLVELDSKMEGYSSPRVMYSSIWAAIKRHHYSDSIKVILSNGKVYLQRVRY